MECFIVLPEDIDTENRKLILRGDETHHAIRSLRLRPGDELLATNLIGTCYYCRINRPERDVLLCSIERELPNFGESARDVHLIQAMISQPSRWEFLLEKATELGVTSIEAIQTERTEHSHSRTERSEKIVRAAVKQTKRARMPILKLSNDGNTLRDALARAKEEATEIILLHEEAPLADSILNAISRIKGDRLAIVVGPEGGFTDGEVQMAREEFNAHIVSLGSRRLRAETAALAALAIVMAG